VHNAHLSWVTEPWYMRLCFLYLLAVGCVAIVGGMKLLGLLYSFRRRKRISVVDILDNVADPDLIARSALAGKIEYEQLTPGLVEKEAGIRLLRMEDCRVRYLCEKGNVDIVTIRRLASLTLLLSFLSVVYGAFPTWSNEFNNANIPGNLALVNAAFLSFARLSLGMTVSAVLYAISSFFERVLMNRGASWKRLYLKSISDLSAWS
jgi:hypothetical protein